MSRLVYFTRETLISLRRNLLMTLAGIMTVAVSLIPVRRHPGSCQRLVDHGTSQWKNGVELEIFMNVDANRAADRRGPGRPRRPRSPTSRCSDYRFLSKQDAYTEFKRIFNDQPALVESTDRGRAADLVPGRARRRRS